MSTVTRRDSAEPEAKRDFAALHIALARRALGQEVEIPEVAGQLDLVEEDEDEEER
ncbi:MAG TPA: hypothetical protein VLL25_12150 [Acidimicrobiales bacterium]|nr:hypothetical protein [Acidimicrobiales bacterium]